MPKASLLLSTTQGPRRCGPERNQDFRTARIVPRHDRGLGTAYGKAPRCGACVAYCPSTEGLRSGGQVREVRRIHLHNEPRPGRLFHRSAAPPGRKKRSTTTREEACSRPGAPAGKFHLRCGTLTQPSAATAEAKRSQEGHCLEKGGTEIKKEGQKIACLTKPI